MNISRDEVTRYIQDIWEEFQREEDQAILQRNMDKAIAALAGKDSCDRLARSMGLRFFMADNIVNMKKQKARA